MDKEDLIEKINIYSPIIFPIIAVWLCAYLHESTKVIINDGLMFTHTESFIFSAYGFAYVVTVVIIEILLIIRNF